MWALFQTLSAMWPLKAYVSLYMTCLGLYFAALMFITWLMFLADTKSWTYLLFTSVLPERLASMCDRVCGPAMTERARRFAHWVAHERNPLMQLAYLAIVLSAWTCMVLKGYPLIRKAAQEDPDPMLKAYHCEVGYVVYATCLYTFYLACTVPAGTITSENLAEWDVYPPDNVLFAANKWCKRTNMVKLPRSKFSKVENRHVPRFDHYCVWLAQSVGALNYRHFLVFLLVHAFMLTYGAVASALILYGRVVRENLFNIRFYNTAAREYVPASWYVVLSYVTKDDGMYIFGLLVLSSIMGIVMWGFLGFHIYLVSAGMTTNEFFKWGDLKRWHKRATKNYNAAKKGEYGWVAGKPFDIRNADYKMIGVTEDMLRQAQEAVKDKDVGCVGATGGDSTTSDEPAVVADGDSKAPASSDPASQPNDVKPKVITIEDPGFYPVNIYNRGILANWHEVLFPYSKLSEKKGENVKDHRQETKNSGGSKKSKSKGGKGVNKAKKNA